jgi:hypothetical protein
MTMKAETMELARSYMERRETPELTGRRDGRLGLPPEPPESRRETDVDNYFRAYRRGEREVMSR